MLLTTISNMSPFERLLNHYVGEKKSDLQDSFYPDMDMMDKGDKYDIEVHLPGMKKEDIQIEIKKNTICISGEIKRDQSTKGHYETFTGKFSRTVSLEDIDNENVNARYEAGILYITIVKNSSKNHKKILIE
jgi:HSP20 family protein